jgi:hypothetical protein
MKSLEIKSSFPHGLYLHVVNCFRLNSVMENWAQLTFSVKLLLQWIVFDELLMWWTVFEVNCSCDELFLRLSTDGQTISEVDCFCDDWFWVNCSCGELLLGLTFFRITFFNKQYGTSTNDNWKYPKKSRFELRPSVLLF